MVKRLQRCVLPAAILICLMLGFPAQAAHELKATDENINALSNSPSSAWKSNLLTWEYAQKLKLGYQLIKVPMGTFNAAKVGSGQCVDFVRAVSGSDGMAYTATNHWIQGRPASAVTRGTAIATFNSANKHYSGHTTIKDSSASVYDQNYVSSGLVGKHSMSMSGYYAVEVPDTYIAAQFAYTGWKTGLMEPKIVTDGYKNQLETFRLHSDHYTIKYQAHVANIGWMSEVGEDQNAGTVGQGKAIEAFKINLIGAPVGTNVYYRAYYNGNWGPWVSNGVQAGTTGAGIPLKGMQVYIGQGSPSGVYN